MRTTQSHCKKKENYMKKINLSENLETYVYAGAKGRVADIVGRKCKICPRVFEEFQQAISLPCGGNCDPKHCFC